MDVAEPWEKTQMSKEEETQFLCQWKRIRHWFAAS